MVSFFYDGLMCWSAVTNQRVEKNAERLLESTFRKKGYFQNLTHTEFKTVNFSLEIYGK